MIATINHEITIGQYMKSNQDKNKHQENESRYHRNCYGKTKNQEKINIRGMNHGITETATGRQRIRKK
jgi:hypothetical protein